jgi:RNase H-fold protein (predicted Holliday junction resolvase)
MTDEKYIGLDVHQATISVAVMDSKRQVSHGVPSWKREPQPFWKSLRDYAELCR